MTFSHNINTTVCFIFISLTSLAIRFKLGQLFGFVDGSYLLLLLQFGVQFYRDTQDIDSGLFVSVY